MLRRRLPVQIGRANASSGPQALTRVVIRRIFGPASTTSPKGKVMLPLTTPQQQSNLKNTSHVSRQTISMNDLQRGSRQYLIGTAIPDWQFTSECRVFNLLDHLHHTADGVNCSGGSRISCMGVNNFSEGRHIIAHF